MEGKRQIGYSATHVVMLSHDKYLFCDAPSLLSLSRHVTGFLHLFCFRNLRLDLQTFQSSVILILKT